jgi:hypothetical protein
MYLKIHQSREGKIVAVCDEGLVGKVLEEKGVFMDLERHSSFYVGRKAGAEEVKAALADFTSANAVGEESVAVVLSMGLAGKADVMYIKKTPYIQIYRL